MPASPYLADTRPHADAFDLLSSHGRDAGGEARARADRSRRVGNHLHFCRWREVARLIAAMGEARGGATLH